MILKPQKQSKIETRISKLEREMALLLRQVSKQKQTRVQEIAPASIAYRPLTRYQLRAELLARGITRPPSPEELAIAAKWKSRPRKEREQIIAKLGHLKIDPPLSELIHQMRAGNYPS